MTTEIKVPALGESVSEATVARWFKQVGDAVNQDEPLVELETDKVTVEVNAPASGVLSEIAAPQGAEVAVGAILGAIAEGATASAKPAAAKPAAVPAPAPAPKPAAAPAPAPAPAAASNDTLAPAVRKLIEDNRLDPAKIPATGPGGRLTKADVLAFIETRKAAPAPAAAAKPAPAPSVPAGPRVAVEAPAPNVVPTGGQFPSKALGPREERVKMTRLRKRIAERLKEAQNTAAMLTTFNEVDMGRLMAMRDSYKDGFEKKHGTKLGFMSFFAKACIQALKEFPAVNAEIDGDDIVYKNHYDLGIAVGTPQGLIVPVVRDADQMSFADLEKAIVDFGKRARDGKLGMEELAGGTFTISNGGVYGSLLSTPIINPPQSAILGMHKTQQRPMVMPDGSIEARPMMYLALSYDHRIIDGREAVSFLVRVKECIEDPARILLDA